MINLANIDVMTDQLVENYIIISLLAAHPTLWPWNIIFIIVGLLFGLRLTLSYIVTFLFQRILVPLQTLLTRIFQAIKKTNEPVGWLSLCVATLLAIISTLSYTNDLERQVLQLRCEAKDEFQSDSVYVYAETKCVVKNSGNVTSTIDTIEPTFYYSDEITLNRGNNERSFHSYMSSEFELLDQSFSLPQVLHPGETKVFDTFVAIPIGWWDYDESENINRQTIGKDVKEFQICSLSANTSNCFVKLTGKNIPNYIYEDIEFPVAHGGVQRINGIGIGIKDFDYTVEIEVDMLRNFYPLMSNENIPILSEHSYDYIRNLGLPWWKKTHTYWTGNSGTGSNFLGASISYLSTLISIVGWVVIIKFIYRILKKKLRARNKRIDV